MNIKGVCSREEAFFMNGIHYTSLRQFATAVGSLNDYTFKKFQEHNDFGIWIREVWKDDELAGRVETEPDKNRISDIILERLREQSP